MSAGIKFPSPCGEIKGQNAFKLENEWLNLDE